MGIRGPGESVTVHIPDGSEVATVPFSVSVKKWFTNIETVKKMYLASSQSLSVQNEEEILIGFYENDLNYGNIIENSERLKIKQRALGPDIMTFSEYSSINLSHDDIVHGSVVVTDTSETVEYTEGTDFEIDYTSGIIQRIAGSGSPGTAQGTGSGSGSEVLSIPLSIAVQNVLKVQYEYYQRKIRDIDYSINYMKGSISRKEGGSLPSGIKIFIDYKIDDLVNDQAVALSIDQAHVWIINKIGIEYEHLPDDSLKYGEAYLALYLISQMSAAGLIYEKRNDDIEEAAKELKLISEGYRRTAMGYLSNYFRVPSIRTGVRIKKNIS